MTTRSQSRHAGSLPVLAAAFAPAGGAGQAEAGGTAAARAVARLFPLGDGGQRILLAVAEGLDDPLSAEAQAAEALGRLEAVIARGAGEALPEDLLDAGAQAAAEGVRRLNALPGSSPGAAVALTAAIVEDDTICLLNAGHGAVFLQRGGSVHRLNGPTRDDPLSGAGVEAEPAVALAARLRAGDAILIASERIARGLGERVIEAVFEEYGADGVAEELADLAGSLPDAAGAAVALLQLPGATAAPIAAGAASAAVLSGEPVARPRWRLPLAVIGAVLLGVLVVAVIAFAASRGGSDSKHAAATQTASLAATVQLPVLTPPPGTAAIATVASNTSTTPAATATAAASASAAPAASPTPAASATPSSLENLPACSGGAESKPCSYTAQPGDSLSVIGDRFDITRACFEAANLNHEPVRPSPPDYRIGVGESYVIPDDATCATLPPPPAPRVAATAPATTGTRPAGSSTTGAASPTRAPSGAPTGAATAAPAASAPAPSTGGPARRGPCTPVPGEQFPRPTC